jgi:hypothetical protein
MRFVFHRGFVDGKKNVDGRSVICQDEVETILYLWQAGCQRLLCNGYVIFVHDQREIDL